MAEEISSEMAVVVRDRIIGAIMRKKVQDILGPVVQEMKDGIKNNFRDDPGLRVEVEKITFRVFKGCVEDYLADLERRVERVR